MPVAALPSAAPVGRIPYLATQILGDLGTSPTELTERAVKRIRSAFPVPAEQEVLWADVAFGTRSHGLVLTDTGLFCKDGPSDDDDDESVQRPGLVASAGRMLAGEADPDGIEFDGLGYHYVCWQNFDPALVSHVDGAPTLGGAPFSDGERFLPLANACVRITNRRVRMRRAAREAAELAAGGPVRSVYRSSSQATFDWLFTSDDELRYVDDEGAPLRIEVPADQYDALLQRMRRAIADGRVPGVQKPASAARLIKCGGFTYIQAVNLARTGRVSEVEYRTGTGSVVYRGTEGLSAALTRWLSRRSGSSQAAGEAASGADTASLATGAAAAGDASKVARANMARFLVSNGAQAAGRTVGAVGARVLTTAIGVTCAPVALVASLALGDACGKAGAEAVSMATNLIIEPEDQIMGRLFDGVLANVMFEYALTVAEQRVVGQLMERVPAEAWQKLGGRLKQVGEQERELRAFMVPLCEAVRRV